MKSLELLAPARDLEAGRIAVDYGADALYIGGPSFGARAAAGNSIEEVQRLTEYARRFRVRVYAALNTLVYEHELAQAEQTARGLIAAGVDALIVQDMSLMRMGLEGVEFHASTQTCNTTPEGVRFLHEAGFTRVILERGLTLAQIRDIRAATGGDLECFVHGAICVGFSGRCYLSRSMGTRSGNRGDCMQACRLPYDLTDAEGNVLIGGKHLLSVPDLDLSGRLEELVDAGVGSFKIEGRLKDNGYVKNVVAHYRRRLDEIISRRGGVAAASSGHTHHDFVPDPSRSFTRGGSLWTLEGGRRGMASFDTPKATGAFVGTVADTSRESFTLTGGAALSPGDGICYMTRGGLMGTNINKAEGNTVWPNKMEGIRKGAKVFRNYDKAFEEALSRSRTRRSVAARGTLRLEADMVAFTLADRDGFRATVVTANEFPPANDRDRTEATYRRQLSKSGDTMFDITEIDVQYGDGVPAPFIPAATLNSLRRDASGKLLAQRAGTPVERVLRTENRSYPYPATTLGGEGNVTNSLARRFYRDHGVETQAEGFDLRGRLDGECVMISAYCLRREIGECLRENPQHKGPLFLRRGGLEYRLDFDCAVCRMRLIKDKTR